MANVSSAVCRATRINKLGLRASIAATFSNSNYWKTDQLTDRAVQNHIDIAATLIRWATLHYIDCGEAGEKLVEGLFPHVRGEEGDDADEVWEEA